MWSFNLSFQVLFSFLIDRVLVNVYLVSHNRLNNRLLSKYSWSCFHFRYLNRKLNYLLHYFFLFKIRNSSFSCALFPWFLFLDHFNRWKLCQLFVLGPVCKFQIKVLYIQIYLIKQIFIDFKALAMISRVDMLEEIFEWLFTYLAIIMVWRRNILMKHFRKRFLGFKLMNFSLISLFEVSSVVFGIYSVYLYLPNTCPSWSFLI